MSLPTELGQAECARLLRGGVAGRVAVCTPDGPHVIPVNYSVVDEAVIIRTSPSGVLATFGQGAILAFEIDHFDYPNHEGWSVLVRGEGEPLDAEQVRHVRQVWAPRPWASGARELYLRIKPTELTGRRLGLESIEPVHRSVPGQP
jgi:nitroimidazol reductase NimA-like FMN-containing flavoprotein (pyridoxamine 5'-phosphate oxidase superfamily)